jgi:hypothetical protein
MKLATQSGCEKPIQLAFVFVVGLYNTFRMNTNTIAHAKALSSSTATTANNTKVSAGATSSSNATTKTHAVRITSPAKGQQVPVGKNLVVSGISTPTAGTTNNSNSHVSIILNGGKPYQNTTGAGSLGQNDYSKWKFTLPPAYTTVKEGTNKITAKRSCGNNADLASYYIVNVTGASVNTGNRAPAATNTSAPGIREFYILSTKEFSEN